MVEVAEVVEGAAAEGVKGRSILETFENPPPGVPICGLMFSAFKVLWVLVISLVTLSSAVDCEGLCVVVDWRVDWRVFECFGDSFGDTAGDTNGDDPVSDPVSDVYSSVSRYDSDNDPVGLNCMSTVGDVGL